MRIFKTQADVDKATKSGRIGSKGTIVFAFGNAKVKGDIIAHKVYADDFLYCRNIKAEVIVAECLFAEEVECELLSVRQNAMIGSVWANHVVAMSDFDVEDEMLAETVNIRTFFGSSFPRELFEKPKGGFYYNAEDEINKII